MSSSFRLKKRREDGVWSFGAQEDHYVAYPGMKCQPGFVEIPIGRPDSDVKMCVRRPGLEHTGRPYALDDAKPAPTGGVKKFMYSLYGSDQTNHTPRQINSPYTPEMRKIPGIDGELRDYFRLEYNFNGTGIRSTRSENQSNVISPQIPYGCAFHPQYAHDTMYDPPYAYDVTQAIQPYELWRRTKEFQASRGDQKAIAALKKPVTYLTDSTW